MATREELEAQILREQQEIKNAPVVTVTVSNGRCAFCGRPAEAGAEEVEPGRKRCASCRPQFASEADRHAHECGICNPRVIDPDAPTVVCEVANGTRQ